MATVERIVCSCVRTKSAHHENKKNRTQTYVYIIINVFLSACSRSLPVTPSLPPLSLPPTHSQGCVHLFIGHGLKYKHDAHHDHESPGEHLGHNTQQKNDTLFS